MDSKGEELEFLVKRMRQLGSPVALVDCGVKTPTVQAPDMVSNVAVLEGAAVKRSFSEVAAMGRGEAAAVMSQALVEFLGKEFKLHKVAGVVGIGGSGGTSMITPAMRVLPVGVPKLMVSTVASGNTAPYVGTRDVVMMPSVVDVSGLNTVSTRILSNAASALHGMVSNYNIEDSTSSAEKRPTVGLTMFGVTTACVDAVRLALKEAHVDSLVFHATGTGGAAMEELVRDGLVGGVLDLTTTEVADYVVGGVMACGPHRFEAAIQAKLPLVLSTGALDMVNFGGVETVPDEFKSRQLLVHNAEVTLMRTTPEENILAAKFIASKLNQSTAPLVLLLPEKGVSLLDAPGMPFYDPYATEALHNTLKAEVIQTDDRRIIRCPHNINDPEFALLAVTTFLELMAKSKI
eukprot:CAMPEP_0196572664 /NCGR_PEP_ID=MMETSP1081-20130531/2664_1 /TAXON_ID=36882 /ORGANISM="Pyramimonas amylifera, Strain CCMP720" /LENGTH=404 /DNA_ID=CAMNT_0041890049 /DNA_START=323 /DNA_END=1537 /DNA_ORIENTATION=+